MALSGGQRIAHGQPPFIQSCAVKVETLAPEVMPYLLIASDKVALPLCPMVFWWQGVKAQLYEHGGCHLFDFAAKDGSSFSFKTVGQANELIVSLNDPQLGELAGEIAGQRSEDGPVEAVEIIAVQCEEQ